ncbi:MAG: hypothetical protein H0T65_25735, partial [Deltaproteobacteria bacterium]|nr:hypothetical protein [Deltaproteobacteria bacterium]
DNDLSLDDVPKLDLEKPIAQVDDDHNLPTPFIGISRADQDQLPTGKHPKVGSMITTLSDASPPPPRPSPSAASLGAQPVVPYAQPVLTAPAAQTIAGMGSGTNPRIPGSGPQPYIPTTGSGANREQPAYPRAVAGDRLPDDDEAPAKGVGWQLISVIAIAAIVGSLTMWFVMRSRGGSDEVTADAAVVAPPVAPVVVIDAAEVQPVVEPVVEPPVDATEVVPVIEIDAAEPEPVPVPSPPEVKPVKKPEPKKPKKSEIEAAWDAGNYRDIVTRCAKSFPSNSDDVRCVLAACKVQSARARAFLLKVDKGKRKWIINACKNNDVDLDDEPPPEKKPPPEKTDKKDCEKDPMSCQH